MQTSNRYYVQAINAGLFHVADVLTFLKKDSHGNVNNSL